MIGVTAGGGDTSAASLQRCRPRAARLSMLVWISDDSRDTHPQPQQQCIERSRLRQGQDRLVSERISVCVVAVGHAAHRVAEEFDLRFRHVSVVVRCARLAQVLQHPRLVLTGFNVLLRLHSRWAADVTGPEWTPGRSAAQWSTLTRCRRQRAGKRIAVPRTECTRSGP